MGIDVRQHRHSTRCRAVEQRRGAHRPACAGRTPRRSGVDTRAAALDALHADVTTELARREDLWRPLATELRDWVPHALAAAPAQAQVTELKKAESWFKSVQADMRAERFRPIADRAKAIWRQLRQQSNVELEDVA